MGDENHSLLERILQTQQLVLHLPADQRIKRGEGLVEEQDFGVHSHRAGEANTLLHAAGQLAREPFPPAAQADEFEDFFRPLGPLELADAAHFEAV